MKVVLDTNVLISGIFFSGTPARIVEAWRDGDIQLVLTEAILGEYIRVANILSRQFADVAIGPILALMASRSEKIEPSQLPYQICEDPDDDKFLACALASDGSIIITGDRHLLKLAGYAGLVILSPRAFVQQYLHN